MYLWLNVYTLIYGLMLAFIPTPAKFKKWESKEVIKFSILFEWKTNWWLGLPYYELEHENITFYCHLKHQKGCLHTSGVVILSEYQYHKLLLFRTLSLAVSILASFCFVV